MSERLIPLEEAAKMLGLSTNELTEMRSQGEVFGYRDGSDWKFKRAEIDRFADERGIELAPGDDDDLSSDADLIAVDDDSEDLLLSSEGSAIDLGSDELDLAGGSNSSNVLSGVETQASDSATNSGSELDLSVEGSLDSDDDLDLADATNLGSDDLDLSDDGNSANVLSGVEAGASDSSINPGSELELAEGSSSSNVLSGIEAEPGDSPSDTGKMVEGEELLLAEDDLFVEDELRLEEDSDEISLGPDSEISSDFEESDLIIDADSSNEIMLDSSDSGINLSPTDSGISLEEEPLQMGGSDISSLELPEDDDEVITLEEPAAEEEESGADDDFMLTPVESLGEDEETSGSQVIALEDSEIYDDSDSGSGSDLLSASDSGVVDSFEQADQLVEEPVAAPMDQQQQAPVMVAPRPEASYSIWNILALMCVVACLSIGGVLVYDVMQHLNNYEEQGTLSQTFMDFLVGIIAPN